ncbi:MAG TPA: heme-binding domain-containing protein [Thermoanaerobaculia bacterium]|nr:heme-binding domain-containing protein [Thermoanaerobaculia bacterium]
MGKRTRGVLIGLVAVVVFIQLIPVPRTNPPVTGEILAPQEVKAVLRHSCYDCHSNETVWPWYSHLAPVSWLLYRDVTGGRRAMNLSAWQQMPQTRQNRRRKGIWEEVSSGDMPLWFYLPLHPAAKLSDSDKAILKAWSDAGPAVPAGKPAAAKAN